MIVCERVWHWIIGTRCKYLVNVKEIQGSGLGPTLRFGDCDAPIASLNEPGHSIHQTRMCNSCGILGDRMAWCDRFVPAQKTARD